MRGSPRPATALTGKSPSLESRPADTRLVRLADSVGAGYCSGVVARLETRSSTLVDAAVVGRYVDVADIEPSTRKRGVSDDDMLHALRHHWRAFETDDPDADGVAVIHAMRARPKFLSGWWTP